MARDPYDVIGVARAASADEIKRAFRKKAKQLHPDANSGDPKAQDRFSELNNAYELLSDADKRKAFDRGEIDAEGKPRFTGFEGFGGGRPGPGAGPQGTPFGETIFESFSFGPDGVRRSSNRPGGGPPGDDFFDIFSRMASGGAGARGPDAFEPGPSPRGAGTDITLTVKVPFLDAARGSTQRVVLPTGESVDVRIPPGTRDGHRLRLRGKGRPSSLGRLPGDAYVVIAVEPHPAFRAEGKDLRLDLPVALDEAILGAKVRAPTLDGEVELTLPAITSSGKTFRLRGKGLPSDSGAGDLYVTVRIVLPEASADLEGFARVLKDRRKTDPREGL
ncbi:DnaJ C-terminal domain-containing protein [Phreatobacter sp.]|uniref:DnaJ C-terminal domain-containing protein n=1 Tax=Phreatobacter sp. TaxID=1966341 RepID=UPI003F72620E